MKYYFSKTLAGSFEEALGRVAEALKKEDKIGTMLPCNVIVQEVSEGKVEVAAIDPAASMMAVENPTLLDVARIVQERLKKAVASL